MSGAIELAKYIKDSKKIVSPIAFVGSYVQALPYKALNEEKSIDIIFTNEGVYALQNLLKKDLNDTREIEEVKGIGIRKNGSPFLTNPESIVPQDRMDFDMPGYAWDLLPFDKNPLDLYRSPLWHANYDHEKRSPYAAFYTSLGCTFQCNFCMINMINRDNLDEVGVAANYNKMRFWSPEFIINEFDKLVELGVETLRIADEMFLLNPKYYLPLCELLIERGYGDKLNLWAYSRVDTIRKPEVLKLLKKAGFNWLCLGIESGEKKVRLEASKGKFEDVDIKNVVKLVHDADINIIANYLFGLPEDNIKSMQNTLDLGLELCTLAWNAYPVIPLPGSKSYKDAIDNKYEIPDDYSGFSFHAYNTMPMPTKFLKPHEVLKFRDEAFTKYHTHPPYLKKVKEKFGKIAVRNIESMVNVKLKRKLLGD